MVVVMLLGSVVVAVVALASSGIRISSSDIWICDSGDIVRIYGGFCGIKLHNQLK